MNIDFVVLWVDSSDPEWRKQYKEYKGIRQTDYDDDAHFRDWEIFRYWFRAVEKYAPWVHHIYVVTNGQSPQWLNLDHPKLSLVRHDEFIPSEYLPTFNARAINLNVHRIPGLADHFVLFDDDMLLNSHVQPEYFFREGLPCDTPNERINAAYLYDKKYGWHSQLTDSCNMAILNAHHPRREAIKGHWLRWHGPYLGIKYMLMSWYMYKKPYFSFIDQQHNERPFLKKTFMEVWQAEPELMSKSCSRFREITNLSIFLIRNWQLASNQFFPVRRPNRFMADINAEHFDAIVNALNNKHVKSVCLNDYPGISHNDYLRYKPLLVSELDKKFVNKSEYEQ